jgi:transmembrane sensor
MQLQEPLLIAIDHYLTGQATEEETRVVNEWYHSFDEEEVEVPESVTVLKEQVRQRLFSRLAQTLQLGEAVPDESHSIPRSPGRSPVLWWAAAIILLALGGGYWWYMRPVVQPLTREVVSDDITPGSNRAMLTLGNGQKIVLDSTAQDTVLTEGAAIVANAGGRLAYNAGSGPDAAIIYNTLTTPRGGQYQLTLPDGTRVWLNAASTLTYPTAFTGKERTVRLTGEGYFEVAHDGLHPFTVTTRGTMIQVLGTHFNINAYEDEAAIETTLLEGLVMVHQKDHARQIHPGQQAAVMAGDSNIQVNKVDTEAVMAWKNGLFNFNQAGLAEIMRQLSRWYNVTVVYDGGKVPQLKFGGEIGRDLNLSQVLMGLQQAHVHFKVTGRTLQVLP